VCGLAGVGNPDSHGPVLLAVHPAGHAAAHAKTGNPQPQPQPRVPGAETMSASCQNLGTLSHDNWRAANIEVSVRRSFVELKDQSVASVTRTRSEWLSNPRCQYSGRCPDRHRRIHYAIHAQDRRPNVAGSWPHHCDPPTESGPSSSHRVAMAS
jgi:hypothetical protein